MSERKTTDRELTGTFLDLLPQLNPSQELALQFILMERGRQDALKAEGRFKMTLADPMPDAEKLACILEEVGEVARHILAKMNLVTDGSTDDTELRGEVVQIAALAFAWIEALS